LGERTEDFAVEMEVGNTRINDKVPWRLDDAKRGDFNSLGVFRRPQREKRSLSWHKVGQKLHQKPLQTAVGPTGQRSNLEGNLQVIVTKQRQSFRIENRTLGERHTDRDGLSGRRRDKTLNLKHNIKRVREKNSRLVLFSRMIPMSLQRQFSGRGFHHVLYFKQAETLQDRKQCILSMDAIEQLQQEVRERQILIRGRGENLWRRATSKLWNPRSSIMRPT
jgi:hypothetical protein